MSLYICVCYVIDLKDQGKLVSFSYRFKLVFFISKFEGNE